jgi:hypothetical protein
MLKALRFSILILAVAGSVGCSRNGYRLAGFKRPDGSDISFDLRRGGQRIEAACRADLPECSNLMLKAGNSVDCYMHSGESGVPYSYGVKTDAYANEGAGLVCHNRNGHGKLLVLHSQACAAAKLVPLPDASQFPDHSLPMSKMKINGKDEEVLYWEFLDEFKKEHPAGNTAHESYDRGSPNSPFYGLRAYVPAFFTEDQVKKQFIWLRNQDVVNVDSAGTITTPWQAPFNDYRPAPDNSLRFCREERDRYYNERGKEVEDDTVLLTIVESTIEK